jgi:hypothetical protein
MAAQAASTQQRRQNAETSLVFSLLMSTKSAKPAPPPRLTPSVLSERAPERSSFST